MQQLVLSRKLWHVCLHRRSNQDDDVKQYYCAPAFVYCFPFLEWILNRRRKGDDKAEKMCAKALKIISEHMAMRGADQDDLFHPRFLPRKRLLSLIILVISKYKNWSQHCFWLVCFIATSPLPKSVRDSPLQRESCHTHLLFSTHILTIVEGLGLYHGICI